MTPEEVHELGLAEVSRIENRYQTDGKCNVNISTRPIPDQCRLAVLEPLGFEGSFEEFVESLQANLPALLPVPCLNQHEHRTRIAANTTTSPVSSSLGTQSYALRLKGSFRDGSRKWPPPSSRSCH